MLNRMMGVSRLDIGVIEEVENDQTATGQALLVVLIVSLAVTLGSLIGTGDLKLDYYLESPGDCCAGLCWPWWCTG